MIASEHSEEQLRHAYMVLRGLFEQEGELPAQESAISHLPALPPIDPGSRLSATDLLSSWFRPPTGHQDPWQSFCRKYDPEAPRVSAPSVPAAPQSAASSGASGAASAVAPKALMRALFPETDDDLSSEDADAAVEILYEFLHAFGRHDVDRAMQFVAPDYHTFEDDREINRDDLRNHLEALLESLHGFDFEVSLSMAPEPMQHPYGIIVYAEIQIDAVHPESRAKRNYVERRLALIQAQEDSQWRIAALSLVRPGVE